MTRIVRIYADLERLDVWGASDIQQNKFNHNAGKLPITDRLLLKDLSHSSEDLNQQGLLTAVFLLYFRKV